MDMEPKCKKAVRLSPQIKEITKIKKSKLPPIPDSFDVRAEVGNHPKAQGVWDKTEEYIKELVKFHTLARVVPRSTAAETAHNAQTKADQDLEEALTIIAKVRDRCIHSVVCPQLYSKLAPSAVNELYLYWVTVTEFDIDGGCEFYSLYGGYSRFFMVNSRRQLETSALEFEYYSLLRRFLTQFKFDSELDKKVLALFLDGFEPLVIADFIQYDELWVRKKLEQLTKIASDNRALFLEMSKQEEDEIIKEYMDSVGLEGI
jgi:hypothetical protein